MDGPTSLDAAIGGTKAINHLNPDLITGLDAPVQLGSIDADPIVEVTGNHQGGGLDHHHGKEPEFGQVNIRTNIISSSCLFPLPCEIQVQFFLASFCFAKYV